MNPSDANQDIRESPRPAPAKRSARPVSGRKGALRWIVGGTVALLFVFLAVFLTRSRDANADPDPALQAEAARAEGKPDGESNPGEPSEPQPIRVDVTHPRVGSMSQSDTEPGTVEAFHYAELFAKVSGYLKVQNVDIGDRVKVGQTLAVIDAPELVEAVHEADAQLKQARAQVALMVASIARAKADVDAANALVAEKKADRKREAANLAYRNIDFGRVSELFNSKAVDEKLVDESRKERDASEAAEEAAQAAIGTARADVLAKEAKVKQADADLANAKAKVQVAEAALDKAKVYMGYLKIVSPYNGVITKRSFDVGAFMRAAENGGNTPILVVAATDKMRVIMKMPEKDVPYADKDDPALVELDALAGKKFQGKVSRIADSLDPSDRTMRVEIDLPNPSNELRDGMFGRVTVQLTSSTKELSVPSSALLNDADGKKSVYIVRDGRAARVPVKVGRDNGIRAEILSGLQPDDQVVRHPSDDLTPGAPVAVAAEPNASRSKAPSGE